MPDTTTELDSLDRALAKTYKPNLRLDDLLTIRDADPERWAALDHALRIAAATHERMRAAHRALIKEEGEDERDRA